MPNNSAESRGQHPIENVTESAMNSLRSMVDANTVIGDPITTPDGTMIIPVSKVALGFASGGSDFAAKTNPKLCFGGGSGTGLTMTPVAFLVVSPGGAVNTLPVGQNSFTAIDKAIDKAPEIIDKAKALFKKLKKDHEE